MSVGSSTSIAFARRVYIGVTSCLREGRGSQVSGVWKWCACGDFRKSSLSRGGRALTLSYKSRG